MPPVAGGLGAVSLTTVADYSVEDADLAGYGLDEASRITVEAAYTKDDDEKTMKMYIGSEDGSGNRLCHAGWIEDRLSDFR